ncbi:hypothetical protein [Psychromonas algicola]|uniref:hypothetical protein n=1 Tax=Psychromonas algicola TaxID=2555642 RepID=UPI00106749CC|nr:hypothetical protein [Psychromonas sp. RZ5]TEW51226.1 hypothetical protein E2R67_08375 [Psychromonas sp. RZ5]
MKFIDAFSPTEEELRIWASNPEAEYPVEMSQDWDLILADINYAEILIKLACEESPNKDFFLSCLYILSGASRSDEKAISELKVMLKLVPFNASEDVKLWVKRSENLFNNPALYNYDGWGWGDLAQDKGA